MTAAGSLPRADPSAQQLQKLHVHRGQSANWLTVPLYQGPNLDSKKTKVKPLALGVSKQQTSHWPISLNKMNSYSGPQNVAGISTN